MRRNISAFFAGLLFAIGLAIGGMTDPMKVFAFLDFFGEWDPSLALVMGGAIAMYSPIYRMVRGRSQPSFDRRFYLPTRNDIDGRLVIGAILFGVGWGLGGFCPGPALVSTMSLSTDALVFAGSMLVGMVLFRHWNPKT